MIIITDWASIAPALCYRADNSTCMRARIQLIASHGLVDSKGRLIGGTATIAIGTEPGDPPAWLRVMATRDGKEFGASTRAVSGTVDHLKAIAMAKLGAQGERYRGLGYFKPAGAA